MHAHQLSPSAQTISENSEIVGDQEELIWIFSASLNNLGYVPMEHPQPGAVNNINNINIEPAVQQVSPVKYFSNQKNVTFNCPLHTNLFVYLPTND